MGVGLNVITSNQASKLVQDSAFQVLSEGSLKAVARPAFTLADKSASLDARKYSATKEFIFQSVSMIMYFAIITTVFQKGGYKFLKNLPKFKKYDALKGIDNIKDFTKVYDTFSKGQLSTTAEQAKQLQHTKGGMEIIKMIGSGLILTILCPLVVAKMVSPVMKALKPVLNPENKKDKNEISNNDNIDVKTEALDNDD
jgi:hypothetical protein